MIMDILILFFLSFLSVSLVCKEDKQYNELCYICITFAIALVLNSKLSSLWTGVVSSLFESAQNFWVKTSWSWKMRTQLFIASTGHKSSLLPLCLETAHLMCLPPCSKPSEYLEKKLQLKESTEIFLSCCEYSFQDMICYRFFGL